LYIELSHEYPVAIQEFLYDYFKHFDIHKKQEVIYCITTTDFKFFRPLLSDMYCVLLLARTITFAHIIMAPIWNTHVLTFFDKKLLKICSDIIKMKWFCSYLEKRKQLTKIFEVYQNIQWSLLNMIWKSFIRLIQFKIISMK
jgi:hypothetical protein